MDMFVVLISMLLPFLVVWIICGVIAKVVGGTPTVRAGMLLVAKMIARFFGDSGDQMGGISSYAIDEWQVQALTDCLTDCFDYRVFLSAVTNADYLEIVYRCGTLTVGKDVIEIIFRNFLRRTWNLAADAPLFTLVYIENGRLHLICAFSERGREQMEMQRNNARSREIPKNGELMD